MLSVQEKLGVRLRARQGGEYTYFVFEIGIDGPEEKINNEKGEKKEKCCVKRAAEPREKVNQNLSYDLHLKFFSQMKRS